jgi:hypothetical protein
MRHLTGSYTKIIDRLVFRPDALEPDEVDPADLRAIPGTRIRWSLGNLDRALARSKPGETIFIVRDFASADAWYLAMLKAAGRTPPRWRRRAEGSR